jgi:hypothetical protein
VNPIRASLQDSTPYFIGIVATILIVFLFIAFKLLSICWTEKSPKSTRTTMTPAANIEQNGETKLTNHSNNLLIISSYNGSLTKVSWSPIFGVVAAEKKSVEMGGN